MKLRNKKTGAIYSIEDIDLGNNKDGIWLGLTRYNSLAELNEEWCDYEEPKEYWYIAELCAGLQKKQDTDNGEDRFNKQIGNYFETEEEAEKAVEKLKAFKRLKDKGFRFDLSPALGHCDDKKFDISIIGTMPAKWWYNDKVVDDIHYIFGGEE